ISEEKMIDARTPTALNSAKPHESYSSQIECGKCICNAEGCKKEAGGGSEAKPSGSGLIGSHPERVPEERNILHPFRVLRIDRTLVPVVCDHRLLSCSPSGCPKPNCVCIAVTIFVTCKSRFC